MTPRDLNDEDCGSEVSGVKRVGRHRSNGSTAVDDDRDDTLSGMRTEEGGVHIVLSTDAEEAKVNRKVRGAGLPPGIKADTSRWQIWRSQTPV